MHNLNLFPQYSGMCRISISSAHY